MKERAVNIESEYDYGARAGVWRLFRLFNKHNYKFTLYGVGKALEDNPAVGRSCVENGHDVASHAYRYEVLELDVQVSADDLQLDRLSRHACRGRKVIHQERD